MNIELIDKFFENMTQQELGEAFDKYKKYSEGNRKRILIPQSPLPVNMKTYFIIKELNTNRYYHYQNKSFSSFDYCTKYITFETAFEVLGWVMGKNKSYKIEEIYEKI